jgi:short-subunit dehydrogenase
MIVSSLVSAASSSKTNLYTASKAFLTSFTQGLRKELLPQNILVTLALPGVIPDTNFLSSTSGLSAQSFPMKSKFSKLFLSAKQNSQQMLKSMRKGQEMIIPGQLNLFLYHVGMKLFPGKVITDLIDVRTLNFSK